MMARLAECLSAALLVLVKTVGLAGESTPVSQMRALDKPPLRFLTH
jgi:hypothetical protein